MENEELYQNFIQLTSCQCFIVYRKDTSPLLMLPHKRDHRGFSRFIKNFKKLVGRIPEQDAQDGGPQDLIMTWGDTFYVARFLAPTLSVLAVFPKETNLGLILNRLDKICLTINEEFNPAE